MARRVAFRTTDLTRALKGASAGGLKVARVEIDLDGKIVIVSEGERREPATVFDDWKAKRDARPA